MQLGQRAMAGHRNAPPDVRACESQGDAKLIAAKRWILLAHAAKNSSRSGQSESAFRSAPVLLKFPSAINAKASFQTSSETYGLTHAGQWPTMSHSDIV